VRKGLERKAGELYKQGLNANKKNSTQARTLFKRILKIVPPDSPWYSKAYAASNAKKRPRDDDE